MNVTGRYDARKIKPGERNGSRVVMAIYRQAGRRPKVLLQCDCGRQQTIDNNMFRRSSNCRACCPRKPQKYNELAAPSRLYAAWSHMRLRCRARGTLTSKHWGDKGITVCPEWDDSFAAFETWALANGYQAGLSIDRVDSNGHYEPSNCEWVTRKENTRRMHAVHIRVRMEKVCGAGILSFGS
jgi:hypothetical protein